MLRWARNIQRHPRAAAAVLLTLLLLAFFAEPLTHLGSRVWSPADVTQNFSLTRVENGHRPANSMPSDRVVQTEPWLAYQRDVLQSGHLPLINPWNGGGVPQLANGQSAVFSPFSLPFYVLPMNAALIAAAFAKLFVLGFFTFLFLRELRLSFLSALCGALVFAFSGHNLFLLGFPHPAAAATLPAGLFFAERTIRRWLEDEAHTRWVRPRLFFGLTLVLVSGVLAGQPEPFVFATGGIALWCTARIAALWFARGRSFAGVRALAPLPLQFVAAALVALGLTAFQTLPFLEYWNASRLVEQRSHAQTPLLAHLWPMHFFPDLLGNPSTRYDLGAGIPPPNYETANLPYVGALALALALVSLVFVRRRRAHLGFAIAAIVWVLWAYDVFGVAKLAALVPGLALAPMNRSQALWGFAIAACASFGLEHLLDLRGRNSSSKPSRKPFVALAAVLLGLLALFHTAAQALIVEAYAYTEKMPNREHIPRDQLLTFGPQHLSAIASSFSLGAGALCALWLVRNGILRLVLVVLLFACMLFQTGWLERDYNPTIDARYYFPRTESIEALHASVGREPVAILGDDLVPPNSNMSYGIALAANYDGLWVGAYDRLYRQLFGDGGNWRPMQRASAKAFALFGTQWLLAKDGWLPIDALFPAVPNNPRAFADAGELLPGNDLVQEFAVPENGLQAIRLWFTTYGRTNDSLVALRLEDAHSGAILAEQAVEGWLLSPDANGRADVVFHFGPLMNSRGRALRLRLEAQNALPGRALGVWMRLDMRDWQNQALWNAEYRRALAPLDKLPPSLEQGGAEHEGLGRWKLTRHGEAIEGGLLADFAFGPLSMENVKRIGPFTLWHLNDVPGRWHALSRAVAASSNEDALARVLHPAIDPRETVVLQGITPEFAASTSERPLEAGELDVIEDAPESAVIKLRRRNAGFLVTNKPWYPGWRVRVNGTVREVLRANYAFLAVPLDAGESRVELVYEPESLRRGLQVALASLALLATGLFLAARAHP